MRTRIEWKRRIREMIMRDLGEEAADRFDHTFPSPYDSCVSKRLWELFISMWRRACKHSNEPAYVTLNVYNHTVEWGNEQG